MTAILDFQAFLLDARSGQPAHRGQLGAEDSARAVLRDWDPKSLQLTPALQKARTVELAQRLAGPQPMMAPSMTLGAGTTMPNLSLQNFVPPPPTNTEDK